MLPASRVVCIVALSMGDGAIQDHLSTRGCLMHKTQKQTTGKAAQAMFSTDTCLKC